MTDVLAIAVDQAAPLQIGVTAQSPHVVSYRFWHQEPHADWTKFAEGHTGDTTPDTFTVGPLAAGTTIAYWLSAAGHPDTDYRVLVSVAQNGAPVPGGVITHEGTTSDSGGAVVKNQVALA